MLITQISPNDPATRVALEGLMSSCPILQDAQFYTKSGAADSLKRARRASEMEKITRSLGDDNTATGPTPTYDPVTKKIVSFDAKVDVTLEDRNEDPEAELAVQTRLEAEEAGYVLQPMFFSGDTGADAEDFDGMENLVSEDYIKDDGLVVPVGGDSVADLQQLSIEKLRQHIATVRGGATHMYMNEFLKVRWITVAKKLGYYDSIQTLDGVIERIGGVIVRGAGYDRSGDPLLPFTEGSSSIWLVRWGDRKDLTCLTSVGVKARYAGQIGNHLINNVNFDCVLHLQNPAALVQSSGWKLEE
jgi:hypothetical protein